MCALSLVWQLRNLTKNTDSTVMKRQSSKDRTVIKIEAKSRQIEPYEERLALSASLAADLLLEALEVVQPEIEPQSVQPDPPVSGDLSENTGEPGQTTTSPDLIGQAAELREQAGLDGEGQTVAVIDSGVAWDHVALGGGYGPGYRVVGGWDFAENDADPYDDGPAGYHGTHVAALLAGQHDEFSGIAPNSDIVALRVFDDQGTGHLEWIESSLQWVHQNQDAFESPITTVNLSVGAALTDANRGMAMSMLEDELAMLRSDGILVFAASGNLFGSALSSSDGALYPASSDSVVAVASVDASGDLSSFAQRETGIIATRGEDIASAVPDHVFGWDGKVDDYAALSGTSMASPQVAAASMLVRQSLIDQGFDPTPDQILTRLQNASIERIDSTTGESYYTVDLAAAVGSSAEDAVGSREPATIDRYDGTGQSDQIELDLRDGIELRSGGVTYRLEAGDDTSPLVIDVGGGQDSLRILGSETAERLILRTPMAGDGSSIATDDFRIILRGFEDVDFNGGGGPDQASLFDSVGSDTLNSQPTAATLAGIGFQFAVADVPRIFVHGTSGGHDTAFMSDSAGDDTLSVRPRYTSIRGGDAFQLAYGFERVYAYATAGGFDSANLYDSAGDDTMGISADRSFIAGSGYYVGAQGFDSTVGHATAGGDDVARIYANETDSRWNATDDMLQWTGQDGAVRIARGFERTLAFEQYEPIELATQSIASSLTFWLTEDAKERAAREAEASRIIFDELGRD